VFVHAANHSQGLRLFTRADANPVDDTLRMGAVWYEDEVMAWIREHRPPVAEDAEGE
jgi:hypothetical protein